MYKWTHAVQVHIVQGSTVYLAGEKNHNSFMETRTFNYLLKTNS